jgi:hypothetical protein
MEPISAAAGVAGVLLIIGLARCRSRRRFPAMDSSRVGGLVESWTVHSTQQVLARSRPASVSVESLQRDPADVLGTPTQRQSWDLREAGKRAANIGKPELARELLMDAIQLDTRDEEAWLWLAAVVERPEEAIRCLMTVLQLNPQSEQAQAGLAELTRRTTAA